MSEKITRLSAGVKANEIDLSAVSSTSQQILPEGVPAGVIGTAKNGPAFVPVTVPNSSELVKVFGDSKGNEFGPIALREWLKNSNAGTYIRVLGAGDAKQRNNSGTVTRAGFVVGDNLVQADGDIGNNPYANGTLSSAARTYFVGCMMSESNGSTYLSDAGLQFERNVPVIMAEKPQATLSLTTDIVLTDLNRGEGRNTNTFQIVTNTAASNGGQVNVVFTGDATAVVCTITPESSGGGIDLTTAELVELINTGAVSGKTTSITDSSSLRALQTATGGDSTNLANSGEGSNVTATFSGGVDETPADRFSAVPVTRGIIFAPEGINLKLSCHADHGESGVTDIAPGKSVAADAVGPNGALTGSVTNGHQATLFLNGYNQDTGRSIEFSFDPDSPQYMSNVFNTDPLKIEEKGHYLYADFPVYRSQAVVTGSHSISGSDYSTSGEPIAFLLTGSNDRVTGTYKSPDFETFSNRYQNSFSPMFISQDMGTRHNLFKVSSLSDGVGPATEFKVSIQNIKPSTDPQNEFASFDLIVRDFNDTDIKPVILESFTNLNLNPASERYIARVIGDEKIRFNFDDIEDSQSIVIEGEYTNKSKYIRIEPSSQLKAGQVPDNAVPFGFRGHYHLQTSGSALVPLNYSGDEHVFSGSFQNGFVQPPVPMIQNLNVGTGINKKVNTSIYWGPQFTKIQSVSDPNKTFSNTKAILNFTKYFGDFRTDSANMWIGNNEGTANSSYFGKVDADIFNHNMFALDKVKVVTGSDGKADAKKWSDAVYVRNGAITNNPNSAEKTRPLKVSDLEKVTNRKYGKFTCFLQGGFDGVNIFDKEKSKLSNIAAHREFSNESSQGGVNGPTVASYRKAIDIMATDADVDIQVLAVPGQRNLGVTDYAISAVESRFDAMYIMDIEERDEENRVITGSLQEVNIAKTIESTKDRGLNSSFAAAYFPDVIIRHPDTLTNLTVPPSVVALGAFSKNDSLGQPWFAPAGFNRTSLSNVIESTMNLKQENLDALYDTKINPITSFAGTSLVIWGQKTLQQAANALDRVNVRRLLIEIRRLVRDASNQIIFEPNREETLTKFRNLVNPILQNVQDNQGLSRYKVIIDTTTTTQADVENNTIRGKILLQPTKTIEFVALDFVVTNNGTEI